MSKILIKNGTIVTLGSNNRILKGHSILIKDDKITKIASDDHFTDLDDTTVLDAYGKVILPGFINAHMHFYSSFARGLGKAMPAKNFTEILNNLWWRLDKKLTLDDIYYSTLVACIDAVKKGTTTIIDHHASPNAVLNSLPRIADAVTEIGLRASLCYELSDRDGSKIAQEGIEENVNFIKRCQESSEDNVKALFGLHASFTISDKTLEEAVERHKDLNCGFHVHCAEDDSDQKITLEKYGIRVVERFYHKGILGPNTICAHAIHLNDKEIDLLKKTNTIVVHNPQSNMNNAVGVADINNLLSQGILVGLGTDAMTVNMLEELRSALWINRLANKNPSGGFMECVSLLAKNNATIANRYWRNLGEISEGFKADIILMDYLSPTEFSDETFWGHLIFGLPGAIVDTTIVDGKILMKNKELQNIDEELIVSNARKFSEKLWRRF